MCDICGDNRFELIEKYKQKLLDATNIGDSHEEMAVIDNILFRFWQMGWLKGELIGNSEQLESSHFADPGKMVGDLISRQWLMECVEEGWIKFDTEKDKNRFIHLVRDIAPSAQQWTPCKTALPKTEEKVWVTCEHLNIYGKPHRYVCKAYHVDRYTVRADFDYWDEGCDEYREEDDQYYVLEGWYECIHNWGDYSSVRITEDKVVAWMPPPEPYKDGEHHEND